MIMIKDILKPIYIPLCLLVFDILKDMKMNVIKYIRVSIEDITL